MTPTDLPAPSRIRLHGLEREDLIDLCEALSEIVHLARKKTDEVASRVDALFEWVESVLWDPQTCSFGSNSMARELTQ